MCHLLSDLGLNRTQELSYLATNISVRSLLSIVLLAAT